MSPCPSSVSQFCRAAGVVLEAEPVTTASGVDIVAASAAVTTSAGPQWSEGRCAALAFDPDVCSGAESHVGAVHRDRLEDS